GAGGGSRLRALGRLPGVIRRLRAARYDVGIDLRGDLRQIFFFLALGGCLERVSTDRTGGRRLLTRVWPFDPSLHDVEKNAAIVAGGAPLLNLAGRTTLTETVGVMARAASVVAVDSGPMHLAALAGVSIVALFGPGDPRQCRPWAACTRIATTGAPCGCIHARCDVHAGPGRCMIAL